MLKLLIVLLILLAIKMVAGCSSSLSCGCGGNCEIEHGVCNFRGPDCVGNTPICIGIECVQCTSDSHCSKKRYGAMPKALLYLLGPRAEASGRSARSASDIRSELRIWSFCVNNNCVECRGNGDCASDTNCARGCTNWGSCVSTGATLNCAARGQRCVIGESRCVDCLSDTDCPTNKPHCAVGSGTCHECLANEHCQKDNDCTATCNPGSQTCLTGGLDCTKLPMTIHCNKDTSSCVRCNTDENCSDEPVFGRCVGSRCQQCADSVDCRHDGNCDAECVTKAIPFGNDTTVQVCISQPDPLVCCKSCDKIKGICNTVSTILPLLIIWVVVLLGL